MLRVAGIMHAFVSLCERYKKQRLSISPFPLSPSISTYCQRRLYRLPEERFNNRRKTRDFAMHPTLSTYLKRVKCLISDSRWQHDRQSKTVPYSRISLFRNFFFTLFTSGLANLTHNRLVLSQDCLHALGLGPGSVQTMIVSSYFSLLFCSLLRTVDQAFTTHAKMRKNFSLTVLHFTIK